MYVLSKIHVRYFELRYLIVKKELFFLHFILIIVQLIYLCL
jgi:hypothetical protein